MKHCFCVLKDIGSCFLRRYKDASSIQVSQLWEYQTFVLSGNTFPRGLREQSCESRLETSLQTGTLRAPIQRGNIRDSTASTRHSVWQDVKFTRTQSFHNSEGLVNTKRYMRAHLYGHTLPYTCSLCGKGYISSSGLFRHKLLHRGMTYLCPLCDSRFTQKSSMKTHLRDIHKSSQCPRCSSVFFLGQEFDDHMQHCI